MLTKNADKYKQKMFYKPNSAACFAWFTLIQPRLDVKHRRKNINLTVKNEWATISTSVDIIIIDK